MKKLIIALSVLSINLSSNALANDTQDVDKRYFRVNMKATGTQQRFTMLPLTSLINAMLDDGMAESVDVYTEVFSYPVGAMGGRNQRGLMYCIKPAAVAYSPIAYYFSAFDKRQITVKSTYSESCDADVPDSNGSTFVK